LSNLNNTNFNQFNFGSMGGAMGNMMGSMARSMGIGRGGGGVGAAIGNLGNNDGINTTKSIGMNYRDNWGSKMEVYGSYSFSNKQTNTIKNSTQENVFLNQSNSYIQNSNNQNKVNNNRASFNIEYKIDYDLNGKIGWCDYNTGKNFITSESLIEKWIKLFIDGLAKRK